MAGAPRVEALQRHHPGWQQEGGEVPGCWIEVDAVLEYFQSESDEIWTLAEVIDAFKFDQKQRFALRGPPIDHSKLLSIPVWPYQMRAHQGQGHEEAASNTPKDSRCFRSTWAPCPRLCGRNSRSILPRLTIRTMQSCCRKRIGPPVRSFAPTVGLLFIRAQLLVPMAL